MERGKVNVFFRLEFRQLPRRPSRMINVLRVKFRPWFVVSKTRVNVFRVQLEPLGILLGERLEPLKVPDKFRSYFSTYRGQD
jgi:hypothetical protein